VTNEVASAARTAFYRVVATSNSAVLVDGLYMVVDISGGRSAATYPVTYYRTLAVVPGGANSDAYKTTNILMRLIPKGTFTMGSPTGELGRNNDETPHQVTLTQPFYIGVFEVTQKQWERVMGTWPSYFNNPIYRDARPVECVSYYDIRENPNNTPISPNWPESSTAGPDSFMGKLRTKTGLSTLDLPTESQWEYACRAGTTTALNSGKNLTNSESCPNMSEVGRYWYNGGNNFGQSVDTAGATTKAGMYLPNAWGLYDMHGDVWEWCLDWFPGYEGSRRVFRGGGWNLSAKGCRSAIRDGFWPSYRDYFIGLRVGFRVARTLP
jgi:formylglycine-generating enzyme required for sulfatase activity